MLAMHLDVELEESVINFWKTKFLFMIYYLFPVGIKTNKYEWKEK